MPSVSLSVTKPPAASPDTQPVAQPSEVFPDELNNHDALESWNREERKGSLTLSQVPSTGSSLLKLLYLHPACLGNTGSQIRFRALCCGASFEFWSTRREEADWVWSGRAWVPDWCGFHHKWHHSNSVRAQLPLGETEKVCVSHRG